jgi:hypothetical protein
MRHSLIGCMVMVHCLALSATPRVWAADSGPAAGTDVAALKVYAVTGDMPGQTVDLVAQLAGRPTLYCFVPQEKWSRPTARLLKKLDGSIGDVAADAAIVAVWVTADPQQSKDYLPLAQQSLQLNRTTLTVDELNPTGPSEWGINADVDITIVAVKGGKVLKSFPLVSPNDTVADEVLAKLRE